LEAQLYQRAQDQRTIEIAQQQAQAAMAKVTELEQHYLEQVARMQHGTASLAKLQTQLREAKKEHELALNTCETLQGEVTELREQLASESPQTAEQLQLHSADGPSVDELRSKAAALETALSEVEAPAMDPIGATPPTSVAMGDALVRESNPLHDFSLIAERASKNP